MHQKLRMGVTAMQRWLMVAYQSKNVSTHAITGDINVELQSFTFLPLSKPQLAYDEHKHNFMAFTLNDFYPIT